MITLDNLDCSLSCCPLTTDGSSLTSGWLVHLTWTVCAPYLGNVHSGQKCNNKLSVNYRGVVCVCVCVCVLTETDAGSDWRHVWEKGKVFYNCFFFLRVDRTMSEMKKRCSDWMTRLSVCTFQTRLSCQCHAYTRCSKTTRAAVSSRSAVARNFGKCWLIVDVLSRYHSAVNL